VAVQKRLTLAVLAITELADLCWFLLQLVRASGFFPAVVIQQISESCCFIVDASRHFPLYGAAGPYFVNVMISANQSCRCNNICVLSPR
jgi:hypothetical protein